MIALTVLYADSTISYAFDGIVPVVAIRSTIVLNGSVMLRLNIFIRFTCPIKLDRNALATFELVASSVVVSNESSLPVLDPLSPSYS